MNEMLLLVIFIIVGVGIAFLVSWLTTGSDPTNGYIRNFLGDCRKIQTNKDDCKKPEIVRKNRNVRMKDVTPKPPEPSCPIEPQCDDKELLVRQRITKETIKVNGDPCDNDTPTYVSRPERQIIQSKRLKRSLFQEETPEKKLREYVEGTEVTTTPANETTITTTIPNTTTVVEEESLLLNDYSFNSDNNVDEKILFQDYNNSDNINTISLNKYDSEKI